MFKIQCTKDQHLRDPFCAPVPFDENKMKQIHQDHSKIKVGFMSETPFLGVSVATMRAIFEARQALVDEGYDVIDVNFTPDEFAEGRDLLLSMVMTGSGQVLVRDLMESGE